jgi:hypothetical protein
LGGGQLISRTGRYKAFPIVGTVLLGTGLFLFSTMGVGTTTLRTSLFMIVLGFGLGCLMQTTNLIAQNSVQMRDLGAGTGTFTFVRTLGGSIGVAALGALYTHRITQHMSGVQIPGTKGGISQLTPAKVRELKAVQPDLVDRFQHAIAAGTHSVFLVAAFVTIAGFALSWFIREVPLRTSVGNPTQNSTQAAEELAV